MMDSMRRSDRRWRMLSVAIDVLIMATMVVLDFRDLWFKTRWLGPDDSYSFVAKSTQSLWHNTSLATVARPHHSIGDVWKRDSGWSSSTICRTLLAQHFSERYKMVETQAQLAFASRDLDVYDSLSFPDTSPPTLFPEAPAEVEVLHVLDIISRSAPPLSRLTCVEGFVYDGPGSYTAQLFGCGSATRFEAALGGHHASDYASLHQNKAFLTVDVLHFLGLAFRIRQNSWSIFHVNESTTEWTLTHTTLVNFASSGTLYTFAITVDIVLLLVTLASFIELTQLVVFPRVQQLWRSTEDGTAEVSDDYKAMLPCPLVRSTPIALLMLVSQLLCWMLVMPNAIVWTWTEATAGKLQAYLSTLRIWVVPLILTNLAWNMVVYVAERHAYAIASRSHISTLEAGLVACVVAYLHRTHVLAIGGVKYALDTQRVTDNTSFPGLLAYGCGFPETHDALQTMPWELFAVIYGPLGVLLAWSFVGCASVLTLRFVYHTWQHTPVIIGTSGSGAVVPHTHEPLSLTLASSYGRLPIETLLNLPIRARSLIRSTHWMEIMMKEHRVLRPSCYIEHGIIMDRRKLRTRRGFFGTIEYSTDAESHAMPTEHDHVKTQVTTMAQVLPFQPHTKRTPLRRRVLTPLR